MKRMKKFLSMAMAVAMVLGMATMAGATEAKAADYPSTTIHVITDFSGWDWQPTTLCANIFGGGGVWSGSALKNGGDKVTVDSINTIVWGGNNKTEVFKFVNGANKGEYVWDMYYDSSANLDEVVFDILAFNSTDDKCAEQKIGGDGKFLTEREAIVKAIRAGEANIYVTTDFGDKVSVTTADPNPTTEAPKDTKTTEAPKATEEAKKDEAKATATADAKTVTDDKTPSANADDVTPKTADMAPLALVAALGMISAAGLIIVRKRNVA